MTICLTSQISKLAGYCRNQPHECLYGIDLSVLPVLCRLGRRRQAMLENSATGFANARDARNVVEAGIRRQSIRCYQERVAGHATDLFLIKRDDLLGPRELDVSSSKPMKDLKALVGLDKIKQAVDGMMSLIKTNAELEELERPPRDLNLNRVFLGNPGTGTQACARAAIVERLHIMGLVIL